MLFVVDVQSIFNDVLVEKNNNTQFTYFPFYFLLYHKYIVSGFKYL